MLVISLTAPARPLSSGTIAGIWYGEGAGRKGSGGDVAIRDELEEWKCNISCNYKTSVAPKLLETKLRGSSTQKG